MPTAVTEKPMTNLTRRWTPMNLYKEQSRLRDSKARFKVVPAGRRSGKTEIAKRVGVMKALYQCRYPDSWYVFAAPTHKQAKRIFWRDLKLMVPRRLMVGRPSESELTIRLFNGAEISVIGLDVPERIEGRPLDWIAPDEFGNMKPEVWEEHIRPALIDHQGEAFFLGTPEGRNHYYDLAMDAKADDSGEWDMFTWLTADVLPLYMGVKEAEAEILSAQRKMDKLTYLQEYEAKFVSFEGQAYYSFSLRDNTKRMPYDSGRDLILCLDFNVAPGVGAVLQEIDGKTCVIGEIYIPKNSNTELVSRTFIKNWKHHKKMLFVYGDPSGGAKHSSQQGGGTDWDIVKKYLKAAFPDRVRFRYERNQPSQRARLNAMNSRLKAMDNTISLLVDPVKAPFTVKDFEGVRLIEGGPGEIDKDYDKRLTHLTDAIGYYVEKRFPVIERYKATTEEL